MQSMDNFQLSLMFMALVCWSWKSLVVKKINNFSKQEVGKSLLTHAWENWTEGAALEFIDPIPRDGSRSEIMRCIHLGLLCVQENIAHNPNMATAVIMLSSYSISLPVTARPAFSMHSETEMKSKSSISDQSKSRSMRHQFQS